jgi:microcystin degradation protein MlrC
MRVAVGGIYHESNTFIVQPMTMDGFMKGQFHLDADIPSNWADTCSEMAGFLDGAGRFGFEVIPTIMAWGVPCGALTDATFEALTGELISRLRSAGRLDGVLLSLHGAMVSESYADADGEILQRVRAFVGSAVPLVVTIDFHANLTQRMVDLADILIGYKTYPHIDQRERGHEAASVLHRMMTGDLRPQMAMKRRPLFAHILSQSTERGPMSELVAEAQACECLPGIVSVTVLAGFPYTDVPEAGFSVIAIAETMDSAIAVAERLADKAWQRRAEFSHDIVDSTAAVKEAVESTSGLILLVDVGDNVGAGTPGDGTVLLAELRRQHAQGALVLLCDRNAVEACIEAGVGESVTVKVGGKQDHHHGEPVEVTGKVRLLSDGIYRNIGPMRDGVLEDQGRTAVIDSDGIIVVLTERRQPMWNLQQLRSIGIEPKTLHIVVVKAAIAYRAAYAPIAERIIEVDTPGLSAADVRHFHYTRLQRPMYPLDAL